jgi:hypothetical protein
MTWQIALAILVVIYASSTILRKVTIEPWQIGLAVLVLINTANVILTKVAADKLPKERAKGIFWQYLFCAIMAIGYVLISGKMAWTPALILVGGVGLVNAFGNYFQWQASGLSLSKTTLFFPLMEIITIALALIFLGEKTFWNAKLIIGAGFCFLAIGLLRLPKNNRKEEIGRKWFLFVLGMLLIFNGLVHRGICRIFPYRRNDETESFPNFRQNSFGYSPG